MSEVERLCEDVAIVHNGQIVARGDTASLRSQTGEDALENAFLKIVDSL